VRGRPLEQADDLFLRPITRVVPGGEDVQRASSAEPACVPSGVLGRNPTLIEKLLDENDNPKHGYSRDELVAFLDRHLAARSEDE